MTYIPAAEGETPGPIVPGSMSNSPMAWPELWQPVPDVLGDEPPANSNGAELATNTLVPWMRSWSGLPMSERTERWLLRLVDPLAPPALRWAARCLGERNAIGARVESLRGTGALAVAPRAFRRSVDEDGRAEITTDQLLGLLVFALPEEPALLPLAAALFGLVPQGAVTVSMLKRWMASPSSVASWLQPLPREALEDPEQVAVADLLGAHLIAARVLFAAE